MLFKDRVVLVAGMALSGAASSMLLSRLGAGIIVHDAKSVEQLSESTQAVLQEIEYTSYLGRDATEVLDRVDMIVVSPGLPPALPLLMAARERGIPVISEIELGYQAASGDIVAITGTNGKTTTTALTGQIFADAGRNTFVLGNIGLPLSARALATKPDDIIVVETAALQLDDIDSYHPRVSAILNVTPDHLDRYGTMESYAAAKARIFENQSDDDWCVVNKDDPIVRSMASSVRAKRLWFALEPSEEDGVYADGEEIVVVDGGQKTILMRTSEVRIPGRHNLQNALAASAIAISQGIDPGMIRHTLRTFEGVEHRIETVCEKNGVLFINDSKGTNPDATLKAVEAMTRPVVLILGGYDKHADFEPLMRNIRGKVRYIVVLGDTADRLADAAENCGIDGTQRADSFESAVLMAARAARPGDVVLLSPACASWDMFANFEERGRCFKRIVRDKL